MFLPRSVRVKNSLSSPGTSVKSEVGAPKVPDDNSASATVKVSEKPLRQDEGSEVNGSDEEEEPVLSYSKLQRWAEPGEPVCVVCGRYGAYIVDRTDQDVCSLECKARHLLKAGLPLTPAAIPPGAGGGLATSVPIREKVDFSGWSYREEPQAGTDEQVDRMRSKMRIKVQGKQCPRPIPNFQDLGLPPKLLSNLQEAGYRDLTPVQMQTIPAALYQRDLLVCAATGSGKTLSFLLPILLHLLRHQRGVAGTRDPEGRFPKGLILTPTRELAMQIEEQAKQLMKGLPDMRTALVVGGLPVAHQLHRLRSGVELIVSTPARLNDIIENHPQDVELAAVEVFVVDEVDCMLSMGFETQVRMIEEWLPSQRQNLMFSATIPPSIARMAKAFMKDPLTITIGEPSTPCEALKHTVIWVEETAKKKKLLAFFGEEQHFKPPVLVFVSSKMGCLLLAETINRSRLAGATAVVLHGDMAQDKRSEILREFLQGQHSVLVTTNVLGRGVDMGNVRQVFIFDFPSSLLDFIHQVGRAGHMTATGSAVTFINNSNKNVFLSFSDLMKRIGVALPPQLTTSPHLALQIEQRKRQTEKSPRQPPETADLALQRKRVEKSLQPPATKLVKQWQTRL